jgi:hypothetical protein
MQRYINTFNHFRSYVKPRPTVWFSCSAPMSENVRHGFLLRLFARCRSLSDAFPHVVRTLANRLCRLYTFCFSMFLSFWNCSIITRPKQIRAGEYAVGRKIGLERVKVQPTRCNILRFIYFYKLLYTFQAVPPPIVRSIKLYIQRQVLSNQYCCLTIPNAVCTVLCYWWWVEKPPETCRAIYRNK